MESRGGEEIIKFELKICEEDVMNILRVISDCVCVSESYSYKSHKVIEEKLTVGEQENDPSDNPLHRAQKLGFTYLYPREKTTTL